MRQLVRDQAGMTHWWVRGAAFLWTVVVTVPVMFFSLGLAVDLTRMIMADRQVATAAHSSALAGAYQFVPGRATLHSGRAKSAAQETMCVTQSHGGLEKVTAASKGRINCSGGGRVSAAVTVNTSTNKVRVTSTYRVEGLLVLRWFGVDSRDRTVWREATVCDPRDTKGPTSGYCTRPGV